MTGLWEETFSVCETAAAVFLIAGGIFDFYSRRIPLSVLAGASAAGVLCAVFVRDDLPWGFLLSFLPGALLIAAGWMSSWKLGCGDGLAVLVLGFFMPAERLFYLLMLSFFLSSLWAIVLLGRRRKGEESFPFLPFLAAGFLVLSLLELCK